MNKRIIDTLLMIALALCLMACGEDTSSTPEEAFQKQVQALNFKLAPNPDAITIVNTRAYTDSIIFLFTDPRLEYREQLRYQVVLKSANRWSATTFNSGGMGFIPAIKPAPLVQFSLGNYMGGHLFFYGKRFDPTITQVEVTFNDGQKASDRVQGDYFLIPFNLDQRICTVQVYNSQGTLLQRVNLDNQPVDESYPCGK